MSELSFASVLRQVLVRNYLSHLDENFERSGKTQFHISGFTRRLVLTLGQRKLGNGLFLSHISNCWYKTSVTFPNKLLFTLLRNVMLTALKELGLLMHRDTGLMNHRILRRNTKKCCLRGGVGGQFPRNIH